MMEEQMPVEQRVAEVPSGTPKAVDEKSVPHQEVAAVPTPPDIVEPRKKAFKIERPPRPSSLRWFRRLAPAERNGLRLDILCLAAAVLGLMSLALPWISEGSDGDLRGLWYYVQGRGGDSEVNVFAITAGFIIVGSLLSLFTRLGGLALLAGVISFITISIPSTDSRSLGFYFAVVAGAVGILSLLLRRSFPVPRRFRTVGRPSEFGDYELNLLAILGGLFGLMCFFLPWFRIEWFYPYTELQFASSYNLYEFSSGYVSSLASATAGVCFFAGSMISLFSPIGSVGQIAGAALFYIDLRTSAADFRYYFGWWSNPDYESSFAIGFYVGIACAALVVASLFVRWRPRFTGKAMRLASAWSLGVSPVATSEPALRPARSEELSVSKIIKSSIKPLFITLVVFALLVSSAGLAYIMPWSRLEVGVWNNNPDQRTHVEIFIDGEGKAIDYVEPGTSFEKSFTVRAGYHRVALDYGITGGSEDSDIDGSLDWASSINVRPLRTAVMSIGLGFSYGERPVIELEAEPFGNGEKMTMTSVNGDTGNWVYWDDFDITLVAGSRAVKWEPWGTDLDGGIYVEKTYLPKQLGDLSVNCTIVDLAGDGRPGIGDYFLLTTGDDYLFNSTVTYTLYLLHQSSSSLASEITFVGRY